MKKENRIYALCLIVVHLLSGGHSFLNRFWPKWINNDCAEIRPCTCADFFWSPWYHNTNVSSQWALKMLFDDFLYVVVCLVAARIIVHESVKLYFIFLVWMLYHVADIILFMWDYKQSEIQQPIMLYAGIAATLILLVPYKEKMHIVK